MTTTLVSILIGLWILKIYVIARAVFWLRQHGCSYCSSLRDASRSSSGAPRPDFYTILDNSAGAQFLPFGLNDYRLRRVAETSCNLVYGYCAKVMQIVFNGNNLTVVTAIVLFLIGVSHAPGVNSSVRLGWWPIFVLTLAPLFAVLMLCIESITAYSRMGSYAFAFHMLNPSGNKYFDELIVVIALLGRLVVAGGMAVYASTIFACGFQGNALVHPIAGSWYVHCEMVIQSIYFSVVTIATVGYGDIAPANITGEVVALSVILVSWSVITFVLASISAVASEKIDK